jgi:archaellum component FlaG (FlaF/FlaG flagellin family)
MDSGVSSIVTLVILIVALLVALAIAVGLAYVPMRLLLGQMARNVQQFIQRQRDRRNITRDTPDRRHL